MFFDIKIRSNFWSHEFDFLSSSSVCMGELRSLSDELPEKNSILIILNQSQHRPKQCLKTPLCLDTLNGQIIHF